MGKLEDEQAMSTLKLSTLEPSREDPMTYEAFGVRTVHRMVNEHEITDKLVEQYHLRLVSMERSGRQPQRAAGWGVLVQADRRRET